MTIVETALQWHEDGLLTAEFAQFSSIMERREYTREQIDECFRTMLPGLAYLSMDRETDEPTIEALRKKLADILGNELRISELCGALIAAVHKPEEINAADLKRTAANSLFLRGEDVR